MKQILVLVCAATLLATSASTAQQPGPDPGCDFPTYKSKEVDKKLRILTKPEPDFNSEERRDYARQKVILTTVFCGSGDVTNINVKSGVSDSVNTKAIEAAKKIRFIPGEKDGKKISQWLILEYHIR